MPTVYDIVPSMKRGERVVALSELLTIEGTKYEAAAVNERIELIEFMIVLKVGTTMPREGGISSFATASCQYICFAAEPAAMARIMRGLRGSPSATIGAEVVGAIETCK